MTMILILQMRKVGHREIKGLASRPHLQEQKELQCDLDLELYPHNCYKALLLYSIVSL